MSEYNAKMYEYLMDMSGELRNLQEEVPEISSLLRVAANALFSACMELDKEDE